MNNFIHVIYKVPLRRWILCCLSLISGSVFAENGQDTERPNFVFILSDDQSWTDYGFMGHEVIQTPHLDRLASQSIVYSRGYLAAPLCRPSLASIVTGQYPATHWITGNDLRPDVSHVDGGSRKLDERKLRTHFNSLPSFIRILRDNGYELLQTGKWWEGSWQEGGFTQGMTKGQRHGDEGLVIGREGLEPVKTFIQSSVESGKPFFVWYAPFLPHTPHNPPERLLQKYNREGRALDVAKYYAMCEWFDETCGELLDYLDEHELRRKTMVIYICDNGWAAYSTTGDWPYAQRWPKYAMRSKASPYEDGIRTPIMLSQPGKLEAGSSLEFAHSIDIFPTIVEAAGIEVPDGLPGINLLDKNAVNSRKAVFGSVHSSHNMTVEDPDATLQYLWCIEGDWKLLLRFHGEDITDYRTLHEWDTAPVRLFNLKDDPGEKNDLAFAHPETVKRLSGMIEDWQKDIYHQSLILNP